MESLESRLQPASVPRQRRRADTLEKGVLERPLAVGGPKCYLGKDLGA